MFWPSFLHLPASPVEIGRCTGSYKASFLVFVRKDILLPTGTGVRGKQKINFLKRRLYMFVTSCKKNLNIEKLAKVMSI